MPAGAHVRQPQCRAHHAVECTAQHAPCVPHTKQRRSHSGPGRFPRAGQGRAVSVDLAPLPLASAGSAPLVTRQPPRRPPPPPARRGHTLGMARTNTHTKYKHAGRHMHARPPAAPRCAAPCACGVQGRRAGGRAGGQQSAQRPSQFDSPGWVCGVRTARCSTSGGRGQSPWPRARCCRRLGASATPSLGDGRREGGRGG